MQKESKVQKALVLILLLVFISSFFVSITVSRYVAEQNAPFGDDTHLDYTVNSVFVVKNQEELFAAINQGYTYVQLDQEIENPLIVTQKAETLNSDLILDLNGIEIQRNGYEPILHIKPGVRLTIVDTSAEQTGGLYNPVGSVFNIAGGTLTVVTGTFESGPRYSEYNSYNSEILDDTVGSATLRTLVENDPQQVNLSIKEDGVFKTEVVTTAPIIKSYPEKTGNVEYNHGNLYFDTQVTRGDFTINPDTYCYYRTSEDAGVDTSADSMADWFYTYYVTQDGFNYVGTTPQSTNDVKITIFGYENTIKQASTKVNPIDYYAAIQMSSGTLDVQNGAFFSYFGVDRTACVNAQGGQITVKKGKFSSRVPNATEYVPDGVTVKEVDGLAFDESYFDNYNWSDQLPTDPYQGNLARLGESVCILNGGSATVSIGTGELYSSNNSIISMNGGNLSISGGNFVKRITGGIQTTDAQEMSAIYMKEGSLDISSANCTVLGGSPSLTTNTYAIHSLVAGTDKFNVKNTSFVLTGGDRQYGIYAKNGRVNVTTDNASSITIEGDSSCGIYVEAGGSVHSESYSYYLTGEKAIGIYSAADGATIDVSDSEMNIKGSQTFGIKSLIGGEDTFKVKNLLIEMTGGDGQTGIYSENGRVNISSDDGVNNTITIVGNGAHGIDVRSGGSVASIDYSYYLTGDDSIGILADSGATGINVTNGEMSIGGTNTYGIKSSITGTDKFIVTDLPITMTGGTAQTGIYSANGKVTVSTSSSRTISTSGTNGKGIYVTAGGSVDSTNYSYTLSGDGSIGILADSDATGINVVNGAMSVGGSLTYGIKSSITGTTNFTVTDLPISMHGGTNQTGIYSANGKVTVSAGTPASISTSGANGKGIYVLDGGSVASTNYSYFLTGNNSIGIDAEVDAVSIDARDGIMEITGDNSFGIRSYIDDGGTNNKFMVTNIAITMTDGDEQTGIFSENGRVNVSADSQTLISIDGISGKGIHVSSGGSVVSKNYSYRLKGATSYGIYSTAGLVDVSGGNITLDSNVSCYGVYAFSTDIISINVTDATIDVGHANHQNNKNAGTYRASVGVFLASNSKDNKIVLTNTDIKCYEVGVLIDGGSLDIKGDGGSNEISTRKASSIIVKGGNVVFDESCNYTITSYTTRNDSATNVFNITLPTINPNTNAAYNNYDGIYVDGGDFTSNGTVNITHTGLRNDISSWQSFTDIVIKSFAVRVLGGKVTLNKAEIRTSVGGGVMCDGGDVQLGKEGSLRTDIIIETTGDMVDTSNWTGVNASADNSWRRRKTYTGGHAVEIIGGNLVIYEGTYHAAHGDGIKLNAPQYVSGDRTTVTIKNGEFDGQMKNDITGDRSGPAGCYGVKVFGPAIINIENGTFNGRAGGAVVGGVYGYTYNSNTSRFDTNYPAEVYIERAQFGTTSTPNDGFMVYDNSKIIFGTLGADDNPTVNDIRVPSNLAAISVNWINFDGPANANQRKSCDIRVYYGTYTGQFQGWNKDDRASKVVYYNTRTSIGLTSRQKTGSYDSAADDRNNATVVYYPND